MQQLLGIVIVLVCVFGGILLFGGAWGTFWKPIELFIISGAALGVIILGNPRYVLREMARQVKHVMLHKKRGEEFQRQLLLLMYELLTMAGQGLKVLDTHVEFPYQSPLFKRYPLSLEEPKLLAFIVDNFRLMAMGKVSAHELEGVLTQEIEALYIELKQPGSSLYRLGEAMPGFGILVAVQGIIMALGDFSDGVQTSEIIGDIGAAMVGTFIGVFFCYGVFDPLSNMMHQLVNQELAHFESVKMVLVTHVSGKSPLLAIDAGRRLVQLNIKPSFAQLEGWINELEGIDDKRINKGEHYVFSKE